jgi:CRISPR-associated protein Csm4
MRVETWKITSDGGGFHFGRHGLGQEETAITMSSDSLFAALINRRAVSANAQAVNDFIKPFIDGEPPFALSSTFPFAGDVHFFPVPFRAVFDTAAESDSKNYKRVAFVSEGLFRELLDGKSLKDIYASAEKLMGGKVIVGQDELPSLPETIRNGEPIWKTETRPRVTLGRAVQNSSIFFTGRVTYAKDCGLWFGLRWQSEDTAMKNLLKNLFAELGDSGLGAERNVGFGSCKIEAQSEIELPEAEGKAWVSLSRYLPRKDEISALSDARAAYRIVNVGGWLDSPIKRGQRRRAVNLLEEGATLGSVERSIPGEIVDVRPSYQTDLDPLGHPVYRSGLALAVGMKGG